MTQSDNWGWQARIGMFIVGSEVVPEAEWWAMVPPNVSVHAARVTARAPWARWRDDRSGVELADDLLRGCRHFAPMCLSAVVVGHSSSSILGGPATVAETLLRLAEQLELMGLAMIFKLGAMPYDMVERSMALFGEEVMPRIREMQER